MSKLFLSCVMLISFPLLIFSQNFSNGVHLINNDNKAYTIKYTEYGLTTRICNCEKPTPAIKNGLAPASMRKNVKGFRIVSRKEGSQFGESEIIAIVEPMTTINCLGVIVTSLEVTGVGKIKVDSDQTVVITRGTLSSRK